MPLQRLAIAIYAIAAGPGMMAAARSRVVVARLPCLELPRVLMALAAGVCRWGPGAGCCCWLLWLVVVVVVVVVVVLVVAVVLVVVVVVVLVVVVVVVHRQAPSLGTYGRQGRLST